VRESTKSTLSAVVGFSKILLRKVRTLRFTKRIHVFFLLHDVSYLRNFDDCIRSLLEKGHSVTLGLPQATEGERKKKMPKLAQTNGAKLQFVPRFRDDRWAAFANNLRKTRNYLMYRRSQFASATYLQNRIADYTPEDVRQFVDNSWIQRWPRAGDLLCRLLESGIPTCNHAKRLISELKPDVVLISPYFTVSTLYQVEYAKAAKDLGVPVGVPVFSWDNLSSKGAMQVCPDRLLVWNEIQKREAETLHGIPHRRVAVTGGMRFAKFFGAKPGQTRQEFCESLGLDSAAPLVTYLGSSKTIAPLEHIFLWRWIRAIRSTACPRLRACNIYVRPHPGNLAIWDNWPNEPTPGVALWDGRGNNVRGVIASVGHSVAVVGINTTAMLEAAALGKPVLSVLDDTLRAGQVERIHFHYLTSVAGGLLTLANDLDEHVRHLSAILNGKRRYARKSKRFSNAFLRPPWPRRSPIRAFEIAVLKLGLRKRIKFPSLYRPLAELMARRLAHL
jgi:hypothetical protein